MLLLRDMDVRSAASGAGLLDDFQQMLGRPGDGELILPNRTTIEAGRGAGWLRLMPAISHGVGFAGFKAMNFHPTAGVRYYICLTSLADGELVAMMDADWITAYRTAATAAIAVRLLARQDAERITVVGSGTQARALLQATCEVMTPTAVEVYSPTAENRDRFARTMGSELGVPVTASSDLAASLGSADVVLSAHRAGGVPAILGGAVAEGSLVCGISSVRPEQREVDLEVWRTSRVVVDDLEHVRESGDGRLAAAEGLAGEDEVLELWQVLRAPALGRRSDDERLLFKSVGTAEQDIALAALVLGRAQQLGLGEHVGGFPSVRPIQSARTPAPVPVRI